MHRLLRAWAGTPLISVVVFEKKKRGDGGKPKRKRSQIDQWWLMGRCRACVRACVRATGVCVVWWWCGGGGVVIDRPTFGQVRGAVGGSGTAGCRHTQALAAASVRPQHGNASHAWVHGPPLACAAPLRPLLLLGLPGGGEDLPWLRLGLSFGISTTSVIL
jgi:hypothetical protein